MNSLIAYFLSLIAFTLIGMTPSSLAQLTRPTEISISEITQNSARIRWNASTSPEGTRVSYELQLRKRINGEAQAWGSGMEAGESTKLVTGLSASTLYEIRVRAWSGGKSSEWNVRENAFTTLQGVENRAPDAPSSISVTEMTATSARISWNASIDPDGDVVAYLVQLRKRVEGVAQSWVTKGDPRNTYLVIDGLSAGTSYDVRVAASDGKALSDYRTMENAFITLATVISENRAPAVPGEISVSQVSSHSARVDWGASADSDGDAVWYHVALRRRVNGVPQPWGQSRETRETSFTFGELVAGVLYEVRVRASDGKAMSAWRIKENAFLTPASELETPPAGFEVQNGRSAEGLAITWPATAGETITLEYAESPAAKDWTPAPGIVESSRGISGLVLPTDGKARFFRLRK